MSLKCLHINLWGKPLKTVYAILATPLNLETGHEFQITFKHMPKSSQAGPKIGTPDFWVSAEEKTI